MPPSEANPYHQVGVERVAPLPYTEWRQLAVRPVLLSYWKISRSQMWLEWSSRCPVTWLAFQVVQPKQFPAQPDQF